MLSAPVPVLRSFDEAHARGFYLDFLGFEVEFEHRFDDGGPLYLGIRRGDCVLHLSEHYGDGAPGAALRIPVDDVSAYMAELRTKDFPRANPGEPQLMPWGTYDITVEDAASNRLTFYSEGPDGA